LPQASNFTIPKNLPDKMTVSYFSEKYNNNVENAYKVSHSGRVNLKDLKVAPHSSWDSGPFGWECLWVPS